MHPSFSTGCRSVITEKTEKYEEPKRTHRAHRRQNGRSDCATRSGSVLLYVFFVLFVAIPRALCRNSVIVLSSTNWPEHHQVGRAAFASVV
jgi:hypothetical protein